MLRVKSFDRVKRFDLVLSIAEQLRPPLCLPPPSDLVSSWPDLHLKCHPLNALTNKRHVINV
uniref:Uncharacterized protein n=1 Tax=Cucumis sativus TaxID=3659 RepID=A0A0A0LA50_CUCSA